MPHEHFGTSAAPPLPGLALSMETAQPEPLTGLSPGPCTPKGEAVSGQGISVAPTEDVALGAHRGDSSWGNIFYTDSTEHQLMKARVGGC